MSLTKINWIKLKKSKKKDWFKLITGKMNT
jgi:hypothetical protein